MREDIWLKGKLENIWRILFPDLPIPEDILIKFKGKSKNRLGCIKIRGKGSIIEINSLFRDEKVPEYVIEVTLAHELIHYSHGFNSSLPRKYRYPHKGGVVNKELIKRGLGESLKLEKMWVKKEWEKLFKIIKV